MSFSLTLLRTPLVRHCARRTTTTATRHLTTASPPPPAKPSASSSSSSNLPLWFGAAGVLGLGAYAYLRQSRTQAGAASTAAPKQETSPLDPNQFVDLTLKKAEKYNDNTSKFIFELRDNQASLLPVASCVVVKASDPEALKGDNGKPIVRPYTPISPSDAPGVLTLLVKKYEKGKASVHIHGLKEGETLGVKGPIAKFPYKVNEFEEVGLIGGGSGITPLYQVVAHALADKTNKTRFTLVFANVTEADILLREEFDAMKKTFPDKFDVVYVLDKAGKGWTGPTGYISKELLKKSLAPAGLGSKTKVFVCGPPGQVAAIAGKKDGMKQGELGGMLKELGYSEEQVYKF